MDALINTTEAAALCGVTTRQFRAWRLKWPDVCVPREEKGRLQFYAQVRRRGADRQATEDAGMVRWVIARRWAFIAGIRDRDRKTSPTAYRRASTSGLFRGSGKIAVREVPAAEEYGSFLSCSWRHWFFR